MSGSPLVQVIQKRLRSGGYSDVSTPFKVAGVEFEFTGAMRGHGGRSLDLVLIVDSTTGDFGDRDGGRVRHRIDALSRALDVTESRYVVTVILAGPISMEGIESLSDICRVLQVENVALNEAGKPSNKLEERQLEDRIRVLLPLTLPDPLKATLNGSGPAMEQLISALSEHPRQGMIQALISASSTGAQAVTEAAALVINHALQQAPGGDFS